MEQKKIRKQFYDLRYSMLRAARSYTLPTKKEAWHGFWSDSWESFKFILKEKENIFFSLLQLATIAIAYYVWVQMIGWIPQEVWDIVEKDEDACSIISWILWWWSFLCVGVAAYPIGIFTACMSASFTLHKQGRSSTILECLKIVLAKSWPLWIFSWVDAWMTVERIMDRIPKKKDRTPRSVKILKELIYQFWKTATLGVIPALIYGRTVEEACSDSLYLLKKKMFDIGKLRVIYSLLCWIIGIGTYVSLIFLIPEIDAFAQKYNLTDIFAFYLYAGVPLVLALFIVVVCLRPLYIISATRIYLDCAQRRSLPARLPEPSVKGLSAFAGFGVLCILISVIMLYRDQLGLTFIFKLGI